MVGARTETTDQPTCVRLWHTCAFAIHQVDGKQFTVTQIGGQFIELREQVVGIGSRREGLGQTLEQNQIRMELCAIHAVGTFDIRRGDGQ